MRFLVLVATAASLLCQMPPAGEVKIDNAQVRVLVVTAQPHQRTNPEFHPMNRVLIYRDAGHMKRFNDDGRVEDVEFQAGDVQWSTAGMPYAAENLTDHPVRIVEIELKGQAGPPPPETKMDPTIVDAKHYKVEFENNQVRVLRVHYDPHDKGVLHEHLLNRVVLYVNDQAAFKAGDLRVAGAATHTEQNAGDQPADRIAVELK